MSVYAIGDLHLPAKQKPMDIFGDHWKDHFARIREDWLSKVKSEDLVLLPGDLSWAMRLEDALEDLASIEIDSVSTMDEIELDIGGDLDGEDFSEDADFGGEDEEDDEDEDDPLNDVHGEE